jgi:hypothetical protein
MRYPPAELFDEQLASKSEDAEWFVASKCIDKIFEADDVHLADDYTTEELIEFIKDLDTKTYDKIKKFIGSTPHLTTRSSIRTQREQSEDCSDYAN